MGNTLEKKKIKGGKYQYFIADEDGKIVKKIDPRYYDCREVGTLMETIEDKFGNKKQIAYKSYYEFCYLEVPSLNEETETQEGLFDETLGNEGSEVELKAIIDDDGNILLKEIAEINEFIPKAKCFIVTLYYKYDEEYWWKEEWKNALGEEKILKCVIDCEGKFVVKPVRERLITYLEWHKIFKVGQRGIYYLDGNGNKEYFSYEYVHKNSYLVIRHYSTGIGLIKDGIIIVEPIYEKITESFCWDEVFIIYNKKKYGFVTSTTEFVDSWDKPVSSMLTEVKFDQLIEIPKWGYLTKVNDENKTYFYQSFSYQNNYQYAPVEIYDTLDENTLLIKLNERCKGVPDISPMTLGTVLQND
jgi:hypothetical protein